MRDRYNVIPISLAALLHAAVFGGLLLVIDFSRPAQPAVPLTLQASLVTEEDLPAAPPAAVQEPEPEPEPEPEIIPEPEPEQPPEPDESELERQRLEEERLAADRLAEQERIRLQQEEDRKRREAEDVAREKREQEEVERRLAEAERKRQEDIERQRAENERRRREAEEAEILRRQRQELDAEDNRLQAMQADDKMRWVFALQQQIARNFVPPASTPLGLECIVDVRQLPGGTVTDVQVGRCNGDEAVKRAVEAAIYKASPLPAPDNPRIFERDLRITFKPEQ